LSCGVDIHVRVDGDSVDFDLSVDKVTKGEGRWGGVPDALLL